MRFLRWFIFSNCLISISAGLLAFGSAQFLRTEFESIFYGLFVFGATLFTYNFQRIVKLGFRDNQDLSSRNFWIGAHQLQLKLLSLVGLLLAAYIYFFYLFEFSTLLFLVPLLIISVFYAVRFFRRKNLRELPYVKIHLIAFVWTSATVILPAFDSETSFFIKIILALAVYLYILAIAIPFDIRDLRFDKEQQKTFPQIIGVRKSKRLAIFSALISCVFLLFCIDFEYLNSIVLCLAYSIQIALILGSNQQREELYFSGAIDGAIVLFALELIFSTIN